MNGVLGACVGEVTPSAETCNGLDDDCDGQIDEGLTRSFYSGPAGTDGVGVCHGGTETCAAGSWSVTTQQVLPSPETCNGKDDDCNGQVDDGVTSVRCYTGASGCNLATGQCVGSCAFGQAACVNGAPGACVGDVTPHPETCNGLDDNCNGQVDEGLTRPYYTGPAGTENVGACRGGTETCAQGAWSPTIPQVLPAPEICNNVDDDCDGQVDEGLTRPYYTGAPATRNRGQCRDGTETCGAGTWTVTTTQVLPQPEACNGLDDNCDGQVDEGLTRSYYTGPAGTSGVGVCHAGVETCAQGAWGVTTAQVIPSLEICDGKDNDCNGTVDDGLNVIPCYTGATGCNLQTGVCVGQCAFGTTSCVGGAPGACVGQVTPQPETCNGLDDNCNGQIDEGLTRAYWTGPAASRGVGPCRDGVESCTVGTWTVTTAQVLPTPEVCDNVDNDCNGAVDDGLDAVPCYTGAAGCNPQTHVCVGSCAFGVKACVGGAFGACVGDVTPRPEVCNGLDDDCNGQVDENLSRGYYTGPPATRNVGQCRDGTETCAAGAWSVTLPEIVPVPEVCDALDNDCNGQTDDAIVGPPCYEGATGCDLAAGTCVGACALGRSVCANGAWVSCEGQVQPTPEVCNGIDDDCDGEVDEDLTRGYYTGAPATRGVGQCRDGVETCVAGSWDVTLPQTLPGPEACNLLDDDCNGLTDDGLAAVPCFDGTAGCDLATGNCVGVCRLGAMACVGGVFGACQGQVQPGLESCNGLDDDCNGLVDDAAAGGQLPGVGVACTTAGGCAGLTACDAVQHHVVCRPTSGGSVEICNGLDDDCDNEIDELPGPGEPPLCDQVGSCAGATCVPPLPPGVDHVCAEGHWVCTNGAMECQGAVLPQPEVCDGIDNDCDGQTDEGDLCDPGSVCYQGECQPPCKNDEFPCPGGRTCLDGANLDARERCQSPGVDVCYCFPSACLNVKCDPGWLCQEKDGLCHDTCAGVTCDPGLECQFGVCVDCSVRGCPAGQVCAGGLCVENLCEGKECPAGSYCTGGECVSTCDSLTCPQGTTCRAGQCVADACTDRVCPYGEFCNPESGACAANPCTLVSCGMGAVCSPRTGQCAPDPCLTATCGTCETCRPDPYYMLATCEWQAECTRMTIYASGGGCSAAGAGAGGSGGGALLLLLALARWPRRRREEVR
ncbi:MAG TPA: MopE-related protein [Polyangia bacterium]